MSIRAFFTWLIQLIKCGFGICLSPAAPVVKDQPVVASTTQPPPASSTKDVTPQAPPTTKSAAVGESDKTKTAVNGEVSDSDAVPMSSAPTSSEPASPLAPPPGLTKQTPTVAASAPEVDSIEKYLSNGKYLYSREDLINFQKAQLSLKSPMLLSNDRAVTAIVSDAPRLVQMQRGESRGGSGGFSGGGHSGGFGSGGGSHFDFTPNYAQNYNQLGQSMGGRGGGSRSQSQRNASQGYGGRPSQQKKIIPVAIDRDVKLHTTENAWKPIGKCLHAT